MLYTDDQGQVWLSEYANPFDRLHIRVRRVLVDTTTPFQQLQIVESDAFGRVLVLDGSIQSTTVDEFIYHESLVHPALLAHGSPRSVLILGGGEGATAREALRWNSVQRVVTVDIDGQVVDACREHMPSMHGGAFEDPRMELVVGDALEVLGRTDERWDVIISDLCDPIEHGPAYQLFTREFFSRVRRVLADGGTFIVQGGAISIADHLIHARLTNTVRSVFDSVVAHRAFMPSFGTPWGFVLASDRELPQWPDPAAVDAQIKAEIEGSLRFVDGGMLVGQRQLPPFLRAAVQRETTIYTADDPPRYEGGQGHL